MEDVINEKFLFLLCLLVVFSRNYFRLKKKKLNLFCRA